MYLDLKETHLICTEKSSNTVGSSDHSNVRIRIYYGAHSLRILQDTLLVGGRSDLIFYTAKIPCAVHK